MVEYQRKDRYDINDLRDIMSISVSYTHLTLPLLTPAA